jgi:hypothetical protein
MAASPNVEIVGNPQPFGFLQLAYDAASSEAIIQAQGLTFVEDLTLDNTSTDVTIEGGFDPTFSTQYSYTILQGTLTVAQGSLTVDYLSITSGPTLVSIAVTPPSPGPSIVAGATQQFTATGTYSDNTKKDLTASVAWISSNTLVATIATGGLATSGVAGSTTITATTGSISNASILTVTQKTLVSIAVSPVNPNIGIGATQQFTASGRYSDNSTQDLTATVAWNSSKTSVATITTGGLATAKSGGSTTIRATLGAFTDNTTLTATAVLMPTGRAKHAQVTLQNGNVLITGGFSSSTFPAAALDTAVLFDPTTNTIYSVSGKMQSARTGHTATLLPNGKVLLTGGQTDNNNGDGTNTAELYDPTTQSFTAISGTMTSSRGGHAAVLLNNGTVLIMGGYYNSSTAQRTAELFNPATNTFTALSGLMASPRSEFTATLLPNGTVLITGGESSKIGTNSAEVFNPSTGIFTAITATMTSVRVMHSASQLSNGHILITGGILSLTNLASSLDTAEEFDTSIQSFTVVSKIMTSPRFGHASSLLFDGTVFITGGVSSFNGTLINVLNTTERFVP